MRRLLTVMLLVALMMATLNQTARIKDAAGNDQDGLVRATLLVYSQHEGGELVWTGTTDGSLPALRLENGYIHNIDQILPGYVKDRGELWIEVLFDGRPALSERIRYTVPVEAGLRREAPSGPWETSETLDDELQIGLPGHELYVASATTGFGVDTPVERVDIDGAVGLKERVAPTPTTDFGKVYVDDSDGHLYFMDEGGTATDLLETSSTIVGGGGVATVQTDQVNVCAGAEITFNVHLAGAGAPYTHLWSGDTSPLSATNIANPAFMTATPGSYNLVYTATDGDGGTSQYLVMINVHALPTPTISAYPATGGCEGEPVSLTGDGCYEKYCWDPGPCTKLFEVTSSGTYGLTVVDRWGCEGTADYTVSFLVPPVANAGTNASECYGGTDPTLGGSPAASGGTTPYVYEWTGSGLPYLSSPNAPNPTFDVTSAAPGVYSVTLEVTDANGCSDTDGPVVITVYGNPVATATASSPVCPGDDINLSGTATGGVAPYSYSWSGPSGYTSFAQSPTISGVTPANAGTYNVTVTDAHGCVSAAASAVVVVNTVPSVTVDPTDQTLCQGLDATFTVTGAGTGPLTYQWQRNTGSGFADISGATSTSYVQSAVTPSMDGYTYRCVVSGVCTPAATSAVATLNVHLAPAVTSHPSSITVDEGDPASFTVSATGEGTLSYQWQRSTDSGSSWGNVGTSTTSYTIGSTTASMDGDQYRCIVTGDCSPAATSTAATLSVNAILTWLQTSQTDFQAGIENNLDLTISGGDALLVYTTSGNQTFTSSSSFTVPGGVTAVDVVAIGGGGGAASKSYDVGGGGGGGLAWDNDLSVTPGASISVVVGAGGPGAAYGSGGNGGNGGTSNFGTYIYAYGGTGTSGTGGGAGGSHSGGDGGGNGGTGGTGAGYGGGGGGAGGYTGNGGTGATGSSNGASGSSGSGGGAGGGPAGHGGGGGGGTGIPTPGSNGAGGSGSCGYGYGGSGGSNGSHGSCDSSPYNGGNGGLYGGGGGGGADGTRAGGSGAAGVVYVSWDSGYASTGTLASQVFDTGISGASIYEVNWTETIPSGCDITFEVRASDTPFAAGDGSPTWTSIGGTSPVTSGLPTGRYIQWRATLTSTGSNTPELHEVNIIYL